MASQRITANKQVLSLDASGDEARPTILFLHYIMGTRQSWHRVIAEFSPRYRCIAVDFRGHGESSRPEHGYNWENDFARDIDALIEQLPREKLFLVGHSLGAMVSLVVASRAQPRLAGIFLEEPPLYEQATHWEFFIEKLRIRRMPLSERVDFFRAQKQSPSDAEKSAQWFENFHPAVLEELVAGQGTFDADRYLGRVGCPLRLLVGHVDKGGVVTEPHRARVRKHGIEPIAFDHCGHGIHQQDVRGFCAQLQKFLDAN